MTPSWPYIASVLGGFVIALGAYWAKHTDDRLKDLEDKAAQIAVLEAMLKAIDKKLDYIQQRLDGQI